MSDILEAKEQLYRLQRAMLEKWPVLVQVGLCLPGGSSKYEWQSLFADAVGLTKARLSSLRAVIQQETYIYTSCGPLCLLALGETDARVVKRTMIGVEESSHRGRLWDVDVITPEGVIDRCMLGLAPRRCLVCSEDAHTCRLLRAHPLDEVISAAKRVMTMG